ncbi:MAG: hypothetical protein IJ601_04430 [Acidaminococcaceae bacterium]|nr:hypothetical protein [Acidaminococcaceae bacterium]
MIEDNLYLTLVSSETGMVYKYKFICENQDYAFKASQYCEKIVKELIFWTEITLHNKKSEANHADYIRLHDMYYMIPWYVKKKFPGLTKITLMTRPSNFNEEKMPKVITLEDEDNFFETYCK